MPCRNQCSALWDVPKHARRKCRSLSVRDIARKVVSIQTTQRFSQTLVLHSVLKLNFYHMRVETRGINNLSQAKNYYPHLRSKMSDEESEQQGDASCGSDGILEQPTVRMLTTFMV